MINQESANGEWLFTKRALYQNGAFTLSNPVRFLPQQAKETVTTDKPEKSERLTGEEAKKIYEDIVCNYGQIEDNKKTLPSGKKLTPVRRAKNSFTKLRRRSSSFVNHLRSSRRHAKSYPPLSVAKLFQSAQCGDVHTLEQALVDGCDVNTTDSYNWSLLMSAAYAGHLPVVQLLLKHGATWRDIRGQRGFDAVDLATMAGHNNIVEILSPSTTRESPATDSDTSLCSLRKRYRSTVDEDYQSSFYCHVCAVEVHGNETDHNLSTIHQFNGQFHSTNVPYSIPLSNKGFQLMMKRGWNPEKGLGPSEQGTVQPIKTVLKRDRQGLGSGRKQKPRVTHFASFDKSAIQRSPVRTRSVARIQDEAMPRSSKRARQDALQKDKQWEINMRRYLNADDNLC